MEERLFPTFEEMEAYRRQKAEEAEFDTGLHIMGGPEQPTPEWIKAAWQKAASERSMRSRAPLKDIIGIEATKKFVEDQAKIAKEAESRRRRAH